MSDKAPSHMETVAARKAIIEGWESYSWERIGNDALLINGGIPRLLTRGPRKGRKTWDTSKTVAVVVTYAEIETEERRYTAETGKCHHCYGSGEVFSSWNHEEGTKMRECKDCQGTGSSQA